MRISKNIRSELLSRDFLGPNINKLEEKITNRLIDLNLNGKNVSYRYKLNKYSIEVMLCSRKSVDISLFKTFKDYMFENMKITKHYEKPFGDKIISWGNFNSRYDETIYKLCYGNVFMNWKDKGVVSHSDNGFFSFDEYDSDDELYRGLSNWVVGKWKSLDENKVMSKKLNDWKSKNDIFKKNFFKF